MKINNKNLCFIFLCSMTRAILANIKENIQEANPLSTKSNEIIHENSIINQPIPIFESNTQTITKSFFIHGYTNKHHINPINNKSFNCWRNFLYSTSKSKSQTNQNRKFITRSRKSTRKIFNSMAYRCFNSYNYLRGFDISF